MARINVLHMPHPSQDVNETFGVELVAALAARREFTTFDRSKPAAPQFEGIDVVVDMGGEMSGDLVDLAAGAGVKYVQAQTNGLDHVEVDRILAAGMLLAHCPGYLSSVALAESAMMFIVMLAHRYGEGRLNFSEGKLYMPMGMELAGRTLGIIGFGASGYELARRAKAFDMRICAIDVRPIDQALLDEIQPDFLGGADDTDRVISECDFLSVHLHLTPETHHIIDARRIALMNPTACLINIARGALVDEAALYEALIENRIGGAGLDAFAEEPPDPTRLVYQLPNVAVMPHLAGSTDGTARKRAEFAADNVDRFERGEALEAQVTR